MKRRSGPPPTSGDGSCQTAEKAERRYHCFALINQSLHALEISSAQHSTAQHSTTPAANTHTRAGAGHKSTDKLQHLKRLSEVLGEG